MIHLKTSLGDSRKTLSVEDVLSAFSTVLSAPSTEDGTASLELSDEEGWMLTAYGTDLIVLDHTEHQKYPPSMLEDLSREEVEDILTRFLNANDKLEDLEWKVGYGST